MAIEIAGLADIVRIHGRRQPDARRHRLCRPHHDVQRPRSRGEPDRQRLDRPKASGRRPASRILDKSSDLFFALMFGVAKAQCR